MMARILSLDAGWSWPPSLGKYLTPTGGSVWILQRRCFSATPRLSYIWLPRFTSATDPSTGLWK